MSTHARMVTARVLERVIEEGGFSQHVLAGELADAASLSPRDRGWVTATTYGVLSDLRAVDLALDRLVQRGVASLKPGVRAHLRIGAWELGRSGRSGAPAALVSAAVDGARAAGFRRETGLVNGVLRNLVRDKANVFATPKKFGDAARFGLAHGLPDWIAERLLAARSDAAAAMEAFNAPTAVTVRARTDARDVLQAALADEGIATKPHPWAPRGLRVQGGNVAATDTFRGGRIAIQDGGAQLAAAVLPPGLDGRILDACAGVGGKTLELLDAHPNATVFATDRKRSKLDVLQRSPGAERVNALPWDVVRDAPPESIAEAPFDAVLVDAPCSALGTLGRHPEVRWNRDADIVAAIAETQRAMVDRMAPLVRPGGYLVYVVCTWSAEETVDVVAHTLATHPSFTLAPPDRETADPDVAWDALVDASGCFSLWPHLHQTDGFFVARFRRGEA